VWVAPGVYQGTITIKAKRLVIFGDGGPKETTLDGGDTVRVVQVEDVNGGGLLGFTVRRGRAPAGGGIYCVRDTSFMISSCELRDNWESALQLWRSSGIVLSNTVVRDNRGSGVVLNYSTAFVFQNQFLGNSGHIGGALSLVSSTLLYPIKDSPSEPPKLRRRMGCRPPTSRSGMCTQRTACTAGGAIAAVTAQGRDLSKNLAGTRRLSSGGSTPTIRGLMSIPAFDKNHAGVAGRDRRIGRLIFW
jgi:hypothetical protein